jgi:hypothetical protein
MTLPSLLFTQTSQLSEMARERQFGTVYLQKRHGTSYTHWLDNNTDKGFHSLELEEEQ